MNFNGVLIGSEDPQALADYYTDVFGKPEWEQDGFTGWRLGSGYVMVGPHDQVKGKNTSPGRSLINIETPDVPGQFEKLKAAGARVIAEPYHPGETEGWIATFADPDDNYFQIVSPM